MTNDNKIDRVPALDQAAAQPGRGGAGPVDEPVPDAEQVAAAIREAADKLAGEVGAQQTGTVGRIAAGLRGLADMLESEGTASRGETPDTAPRPAEAVGSDGDSVFPGPPSQPPTGPQDPVHPQPAVAPGGLGYLMTLSHEEEEQIEWGSKSAT